MDIAPVPPEVWPMSIRGVNSLPPPQKHAIYRTLIMPWIYERYHVDPLTLTQNGREVVCFNCPPHSRAMEIAISHQPDARDPVLSITVTDTFNNQLQVLMAAINDPESPRFDIDVDSEGKSTQLGSARRNLPAELAAMEAGLAPGQIRAGLRALSTALEVFEQFIVRMGHNMFMVEPFAYHNAVTFERYGFNYLKGRREMERIHQEFQPGGELHVLLDGSTPFRPPDAWKSARGRSWAIHDGILGHPYTGFQMYKRVGVNAEVNTFPDSQW